MKLLKSALVGTGAIAREHLAALSELPNVKTVAVCDLSPARAEATAERFGVPAWYTDYRRMLLDHRPDLVHVTTPPPSHYAIVRDCIDAGLNVFCEKPITVEYAQFRDLRERASSRGVLLVENQNLRFHSSVLRIQELLRSGDLGEIVNVRVAIHLNVGARGSRYVDPNAPHPCLSMRGGAIADFLTHIAYLVHAFAGRLCTTRNVWEKRDSSSPLPVDEFRALLRCDRSLATVAFSANAQPSGCWLAVSGTRAHAEANLFEPPRLTLRRVRPGAPPLATLIDGVAESRALLRGATVGFWRKLAGTSSYDGLPLFVSKVYAALEDGSPPPVTLDDVDEVARMVAAFTDTECSL